ncbi:biosynthetic-type acetolactate synthase large subunit [Selenomonadales bacterium OttesenSCG-928-I06]|nr:biosynthetic-type acetolactate synthase large subunit [Selenomonadales bacterium OttesenSCG-928-I06]
MLLSGAQIIVKCLERQGVDIVFGYPGGAILPFYDALYDSKIRHVLTVHEQGAAHSADGYARASGKVGVCIATSGPGATNLVTGIANAFLDSIPLVAITGQVSTDLIGRDSFQEIDITGITLPITKHNFLVNDIKKLPQIIESAFSIAKHGRPGPVLVDIPRDIQIAEYDFPEEFWGKLKDDIYKKRILSSNGIQDKIMESAQIINKAKKPVILAGGGVVSANADQELKYLSEHGNIPVVSTLMGLGSYPTTGPNYIGMTGLHGLKCANRAVHNADVLIVIGSRFNDRITGNRKDYAAGKKIIHIDIDVAEIKKNVNIKYGLVGDIVDIVKKLNEYIEPRDHSDWFEKIRETKSQNNDGLDNDELNVCWVMEEINSRNIDGEAIFTTDVGQHQMWCAQNLKISKIRSFISSGGLGTMGFGLPAAIGAQIAVPEKRAISISGDGGFKMTGSELYTIAAEKLPVISIVVNNSTLGMIRQLQTVFYKDRFIASNLEAKVDYVALAKAYGIRAYNVVTKEQFRTAFDAAWQEKSPCLIVVDISEKHLVRPMLSLESDLDTYDLE